jgi:hypothetical protein
VAGYVLLLPRAKSPAGIATDAQQDSLRSGPQLAFKPMQLDVVQVDFTQVPLAHDPSFEQGFPSVCRQIAVLQDPEAQLTFAVHARPSLMRHWLSAQLFDAHSDDNSHPLLSLNLHSPRKQ